jgi:hypothetical protein
VGEAELLEVGALELLVVLVVVAELILMEGHMQEEREIE